jgi:hypothetical protein
MSSQVVSRRSDDDQCRCAALLYDGEGQPIGKVVQAKQDRLVGRGAGTVLLVRRRPRPSAG